MKYYENVLELMGKTPLVRLNKVAANKNALVLAKVEFFNPGGSIKDRIGLKMLEEAEKEGKIKKGSLIVEPTSGNTGAGICIVSAVKGYRVVVTMPDKMSKEKERLLRAYGAEVIWTPTSVEPDDPRSYYKVAEKVLSENPGSFSPDQYHNKNNPLAHYETTAKEIWEDTDGKITHLVAGMGTGGTITGVGRFLKERNPAIKIIGVDPEGSLYHHKFYGTEGEIKSYKLEGIGEDMMPDTIDFDVIDEVVVVNDRDAFLMARRLAREEGLLVGGSSGAAVFALSKISETLSEGDVVVVILPDSGRNYLSTIFNDEWMKENGFLD